MNVRIQNNHLSGLEGAEAKRTESTSGPTSSPAAGVGAQTPQSDRVEISSISEAITAAGDAIDTQRAGRVKTLSALYGSGNYQVAPEKLANAMVSVALEANGPKDQQ